MLPRPAPLPRLLCAALALGGLLAACGTDTSTASNYTTTGCCVGGVHYYLCSTATAYGLCTSAPADTSQCTLQAVSCPAE